MKIRVEMFTGLMILAAVWAGADVVTINSSVTGIQGWNSAIWGAPAGVPTSGNEYVHDDSSSAILLGMGATYGSFAGARLTLDSGTVLYNKGGGSLGGALYLNGGQWQSRSAGTAVILGNIRVAGNSTVLLVDGNMQWNTGLSSTADAVLSLQSWNNSRSLLINSSDSGFMGTFSILDSGSAAVNWTIQFDKSYTNAVLKIEGQKNDAAYAAVYQLTGDIAFEDVFMPNGSGGLVDLTPGTYDAAALALAGVSSDYYDDLGGTITVIPEPATLGMLGIGGLLVILLRRLRG